MCQLQEIQFSCGHTRKVLHKACASAQRLSIAPVRLPPSHCPNGLHVDHSTKSDEQCGRTDRGLTCVSRQAQNAVDEKVMEVRQTMEHYHKRMVNIKEALERVDKPAQGESTYRHTLRSSDRQAKLENLREKFLLTTFRRWETLLQDNRADLARTYDEFLKSIQENDKQAHHGNPAVRMGGLKALTHEADCLVEQFDNACWVWQFEMTCIGDSAESDASWEGLADMGWVPPRPEDTRMMDVLEAKLSVRQPRGYYRTGVH